MIDRSTPPARATKAVLEPDVDDKSMFASRHGQMIRPGASAKRPNPRPWVFLGRCRRRRSADAASPSLLKQRETAIPQRHATSSDSFVLVFCSPTHVDVRDALKIRSNEGGDIHSATLRVLRTIRLNFSKIFLCNCFENFQFDSHHMRTGLMF